MGFLGTAFASFAKRKTQVGRFLRKNNPAPKGFKAFALKYDNLADVWQECKRPDWMLWMMNCLAFTPADALRLFACYSARRFASSMKDPRSVAVIEVAEKFARREADWEDVESARRGAYQALEEAKRSNNDLAEALAWAAASTGKEDPYTCANDTYVYCCKLAEMQKKDLLLLREMQCGKLRDLLGNPFKIDEEAEKKAKLLRQA